MDFTEIKNVYVDGEKIIAIYNNGEKIWGDVDTPSYITFHSDGDQTLTIGWYAPYKDYVFYYSTDTGNSKTWTRLESNVPVSFNGDLYLCGNNTTGLSVQMVFGTDAAVSSSGNLAALIDKENPPEQLEGTQAVLAGLFKECTVLTSVPDVTIKCDDAPDGWAFETFYGCSSITDLSNVVINGYVPENSFYSVMAGAPCTFMGCTSLTKTPTMNLTGVGYSGCAYAFKDNTSLTDASNITINGHIEEAGCEWMFGQSSFGAGNLIKAPKIIANGIDNRGCASMFEMQMNLTDAEQITLIGPFGEMACASMFNICPALNCANIAINGTVGKYGLSSMFSWMRDTTVAPTVNLTGVGEYGCNSAFNFNNVTDASTISISGNIDANGLYQAFMFSNAYNTPKLNLNNVGDYGCKQMFSSDSAIVDASNITITGTIGKYGCQQMFNACTNLIKPPKLNLTYIDEYGCASMFAGCTSLGYVAEMIVSNLNQYACAQMYAGCTALTDAEDMVINGTIGEYGCQQMFQNCSYLTNTPTINVSYVNDYGFNYAFQNCAKLVSADNVIITGTIGKHGCDYMFSNDYLLAYFPDINGVTTIDEYGCDHMMFGAGFQVSDREVSCNLDSLVTVGDYGCHNMYQFTKIKSAYLSSLNTISANAMSEMFMACTNLNYIHCHATSILGTVGSDYGTTSWTDGVAATGIFVKANAMEDWIIDSVNGVPTGWTLKNEDPEPTTDKWLSIKSLYGAQTVNVTYDSGKVYYSWDKTTSTEFTSGTTVTLPEDGILYVNGEMPVKLYFTFGTGGYIYMDGNIMSLIDRDNPPTVIPDGITFESMFNSTLTSKQYVHGAPPLNMITGGPAKAFMGMFAGCYLDECPALPNITDVKDYMYASMFLGCELMKGKPVMNITSIGKGGCSQMFSGCKELEDADITLPSEIKGSSLTTMFYNCVKFNGTVRFDNVTTIGIDGCSNMFDNCKTMTYIPNMSGVTSIDVNGCENMFRNTALKTTPTMSDFTLTYSEGEYHSNGMRQMFAGCTKLEIANITLPAHCWQGCQSMFSGCTNLRITPDMDSVIDGMFGKMFYNCTSLTSFPKMSSYTVVGLTSSTKYEFTSMCEGCTALTTVEMYPSLTQINSGMAKNMFKGCTSLNSIKTYVTTIIGTYGESYYGTCDWVNGVSSSGVFYKPSTATQWVRGVHGIPTNWTIVEF